MQNFTIFDLEGDDWADPRIDCAPSILTYSTDTNSHEMPTTVSDQIDSPLLLPHEIADNISLLPPLPSTNRKKRNIWTLDEDEKLYQLAIKYNYNWARIAKEFPQKSQQNVERRWSIRHNPNIKRTKWENEEDLIIIQSYKELGGNWKKIAERLPGRLPDTVKNRYYGSLKKKFPHLCENSTAAEQDQPEQDPISEEQPDENDIIDSIMAEPKIDLDETIDLMSLHETTPVKDNSIEEKRKRIQELYQQMANLEHYLNLTKDQLKCLESEVLNAVTPTDNQFGL